MTEEKDRENFSKAWIAPTSDLRSRIKGLLQSIHSRQANDVCHRGTQRRLCRAAQKYFDGEQMEAIIEPLLSTLMVYAGECVVVDVATKTVLDHSPSIDDLLGKLNQYADTRIHIYCVSHPGEQQKLIIPPRFSLDE